jgi:DNA-binding NtrC family response regulator
MTKERVLIVDDEQDYSKLLSERMQHRGLMVSTACNGQEALEKIRAEGFDAIILDMKMPAMDGVETLKRIKEVNVDLQVIFLTGYATVEKGVEAMKLGAMDFLQKPAELTELMERIEAAGTNMKLLREKKSEEQIMEILARKI